MNTNARTSLRRHRVHFLLTILLAGSPCGVVAHPGSGVVVDRQGHIYFVDTGSGVWRVDRSGNLSRIPGPAYHWMAIDAEGRLKNVSLPYFSSGDATVTRVGDSPTLLLSSDFPIVVGRDGALYYPWLSDGKTLQLFRLAPSGTTEVFKTFPASGDGAPLRWLNGVATAFDGSVYVTENRAIRKITPEGTLTTVVENVTLPGCDSVPGIEAHLRPYFRGLAVDSQGTIYVAASGCRAVLKITPDKKLSTVLRASSPWSPTGVDVFGGDVYVLEYTHSVGDDRREWVPRIRRVTPDGNVATIVTIKR
jgi:hypothetical protein